MMAPSVDGERTMPQRILAIDIEGGHGGSSRSLLQTLRQVNRDHAELEVWCRIGGQIEQAYDAIGIPVRVMPEMPRLTALVRGSRNFIDTSMFFLKRWPHAGNFRNSLLERLKSIDLLHLNHISLFWVARWVRKHFPNLPITMHIRTQPTDSLTARWQSRTVVKACSGFVFITENERDHLAQLSSCEPTGTVIYNPVEVQKPSHGEWGNGHAEEKTKGLTAVCLSNYSYARGIDRLVDVARCLDQIGDNDVHFIVAGDMQLGQGDPGELGRIGRANGTLADFSNNAGVSHRFTFPGHVSDPETLLGRADVLLKPTRENNPWGRDILEALGHGLPVASVGTYDKFVESGRTGLLQPSFDAEALATWLVELSNDHEGLRLMQRQARKRIAAFCSPVQQAEAIVRFWRETAGSN
jgi:glycosyltransferase involved in cell wall biosynthesis